MDPLSLQWIPVPSMDPWFSAVVYYEPNETAYLITLTSLAVCHRRHNAVHDILLQMAWEVEFSDEFGDWWNGLDAAEQKSVDFSVALLSEAGRH
jgi:hypothetical protein